METIKKRQSVSMYAAEYFIVSVVARDRFEGNESLALRHIVREYGDHHGIVVPITQPDQPKPTNGKQKGQRSNERAHAKTL
jgi:hypothetical protein